MIVQTVNCDLNLFLGFIDRFYNSIFTITRWRKIDLGATCEVYAILMWHYHLQSRAYKAIVVQISDDPEFKKEAVAVQVDVQFIDHVKLKAVVDELFSVPDHLKERARKYFN